MRRHNAEQGFVLITALWLLLLCAAVVSLAMFRNGSQARAAANDADIVQRRLDLDAAVETIAADLLIKGPTSVWAQIPAQHGLQINGRDVSVELSSERGRLDLNSGDVATIDRALQGFGASPYERASFNAAMQSQRSRNLGNFAAAKPLLALLGSIPCPAQLFTVYSGLTQPDETQMSSEIARALGNPGAAAMTPQAIRPGTAIRLYLRHPGGTKLETIMRLGGSGRPYDVMAREQHPGC